mmetsp:Transcript_57859/g.126838  ORF Transcript_57859/g.126838 Transcript_57859/m.126838 type:complete len:101 (-) Transcript_57859:141-443(-)
MMRVLLIAGCGFTLGCAVVLFDVSGHSSIVVQFKRMLATFAIACHSIVPIPFCLSFCFETVSCVLIVDCIARVWQEVFWSRFCFRCDDACCRGNVYVIGG